MMTSFNTFFKTWIIAVLTLYMRQILGFSEDKATVYYHTFIMLCYFTPIPGSILADTYLGKFK